MTLHDPVFEDYELTFIKLALEHYRKDADEMGCNFLVKQADEIIKQIEEELKNWLAIVSLVKKMLNI